MALVSELLQPQHGPVPAVCEGSLEQLEDLSTEGTRVHIKSKDAVTHELGPLWAFV